MSAGYRAAEFRQQVACLGAVSEDDSGRRRAASIWWRGEVVLPARHPHSRPGVMLRFKTAFAALKALTPGMTSRKRSGNARSIQNQGENRVGSPLSANTTVRPAFTIARTWDTNSARAQETLRRSFWRSSRLQALGAGHDVAAHQQRGHHRELPRGERDLATSSRRKSKRYTRCRVFREPGGLEGHGSPLSPGPRPTR